MITNLKSRLTAAVVLSCFALLIFVGFTVSAEGLVPDPELAAAIRNELGLEREEITPYEMLELKTLRASHVNSLQGLGYGENLEELYLDNLDPFVDLEIIFGLEDLSVLSITNSHLYEVNISGIQKLSDLRVLNLGHNRIHKYSGISGLPNLEELYLHQNHLECVVGISRLKKLRRLDLSRNELTQIDPIAKLVNLDFLDLSNNKITDISPLVNNEGLMERDVIMLQYNFLDLFPGSEIFADITALYSRDVELRYFPQHTKK